MIREFVESWDVISPIPFSIQIPETAHNRLAFQKLSNSKKAPLFGIRSSMSHFSCMAEKNEIQIHNKSR